MTSQLEHWCKMVRRCVVGRCDNTNHESSLHVYPSDVTTRKRWDKFVSSTRKDWKHGNDSSVICGKHFRPEDFEGYQQFLSGYRNRLTLKPGAVPTIRTPAAEPKPQNPRRAVQKLHVSRMVDSCTDVVLEDGASGHSGAEAGVLEEEASTINIPESFQPNSTEIGLCRQDVIMDTLPYNNEIHVPQKQSRGTQLGLKKENSRSIGIQVDMSVSITNTHDVGVQCEQISTEMEDFMNSAIFDVNSNTKDNVPNDILTEEPLVEEPEPCHLEEKFLVFKWQLLQLFQFCPSCHSRANGVISKRVGTCIHVMQKCKECNFVNTWASQPYIGKMPAGNLLLSGSILYSGSLSSKCLLMFKFLNMACIGRSTFFRHQQQYILPTIVLSWRQSQSSLIAELRAQNRGLVLAGDGRSDSPGHCAKYGAFTFIETKINKVLDIQQVQSSCFCSSLFLEQQSEQ
ncbi:uncharacterized protein LOC111111563 isoform X1 [Crassostrea virginica]